jgi:outer membrane protein TolC
MASPVRHLTRPTIGARRACSVARIFACVVGALLGGAGARAQQMDVTSSFQGGVPKGVPTENELALTLSDAIARGLANNLAAIVAETSVDAAGGSRTAARADLLPQLRGSVSGSRQRINLAAYGFATPGMDAMVGPFNVFDARASIRQSILDLKALNRARSASRSLEAARQDERSVRDLVVLVCGQLYLQAVAGESRIAVARAQLETAESLLTLARDRKASGLAAGIEVLRADVQEQLQRQRLIVAEEEAAKEKLALARAIGLPLGQRFSLADAMPFAPPPALTAKEAAERAWRERPDLRAAVARVEAAGAARRAAFAENLPSLGVSVDAGAIGNDVAGARFTYSMAAALQVPLFEGGRAAGHAREAEARLRVERARLEDLRARIFYEIESVFLDLDAAAARVGVAGSALGLATQQLEQARDRFASGVAGTLELVQAQEALATAEENRISSLYAHNVARFALARALGGAETSYATLLKGQ